MEVWTMASGKTPQVLVLGGNLGGLTAARFIREQCKDRVGLTVLDRRDDLVFVPNIPLEVLANHSPARSLRMPIAQVLESDGTRFLQAEVTEIDLDRRRVTYVPAERPGSAPEQVTYDFLVVALGARLAYDRIEGFGDFGHTFSDTYYGNRVRWYLHEAERLTPPQRKAA
jgi:sulfide:quinone oxidoreductase